VDQGSDAETDGNATVADCWACDRDRREAFLECHVNDIPFSGQRATILPCVRLVPLIVDISTFLE
jgi:hypothetical protein